MEIIYADPHIVVCVKPQRVLSTDEPGGVPELVRQELGTQDVRTVHRNTMWADCGICCFVTRQEK